MERLSLYSIRPHRMKYLGNSIELRATDVPLWIAKTWAIYKQKKSWVSAGKVTIVGSGKEIEIHIREEKTIPHGYSNTARIYRVLIFSIATHKPACRRGRSFRQCIGQSPVCWTVNLVNRPANSLAGKGTRKAQQSRCSFFFWRFILKILWF